MLKLYAWAGSCSLAPHIIVKELDLPCEVRLLQTESAQDWQELARVNEMEQVPVLITEVGYPLTEGAAILQWLASKKGGRVFPESGPEHFQALQWLNFISSSLHAAFGPLFVPSRYTATEAHQDGIRSKGLENLRSALKVAEKRLSPGEYALGRDFTVVDAYLFAVLRWTRTLKMNLTAYPKLSAFMERIASRPSVIAAMKAENLL